MDKATAIEKAGGVKQLADILGISQQAVYKWKEAIPPISLYRLKELKPAWFRKPRVAA